MIKKVFLKNQKIDIKQFFFIGVLVVLLTLFFVGKNSIILAQSTTGELENTIGVPTVDENGEKTGNTVFVDINSENNPNLFKFDTEFYSNESGEIKNTINVPIFDENRKETGEYLPVPATEHNKKIFEEEWSIENEDSSLYHNDVEPIYLIGPDDNRITLTPEEEQVSGGVPSSSGESSLFTENSNSKDDENTNPEEYVDVPQLFPTQDRSSILEDSEVPENYVDPGVSSGPGKFLWKPISESDQKLVILYDAPGEVHLFIPTGGGHSYFETCRSDPRAGTNNGYLNGARCSRPGSEYPNGTIVKIGMTEIPIPDTSQRVQKNVNFINLSINDFLKSEDEEQTLFDSLLILGGAAVGCAMENLLSNLLVSTMSELSALIPSLAVPVEDVRRKAQEEGPVPMVPGMDTIAYCLINSLIIGLSDATIEWINGGFEGKPVFVDDPSKFFQDVADREMSVFLTNLADGALCKEFGLDVKLAIINQQTSQRGGWCTLDRAKENIQKTISGERFSFDVFDQMVDNPSNTPVGAYLILDGQLRTNIYEEAAELSQELEWGNGYFSWKNCEEVEPVNGVKQEPICKTVTPGHVVQSQTLGRLGLAEERMVLADEFNEILTALVNQLIKIGAQEILGA